jgi:hypothetical protein
MDTAKDWTPLYQLVRDRSRVQQVALDLLQLLHDHRHIRADSPAAGNAYDLLAGAAFSLWRAVFLAESTDGWEATLANAEAILEKVIRHNAIGYMDDWSNRRWSFLYYLNNARYRLNEFANIVPQFRAALDTFGDLSAIDKPALGRYPSHAFNAHCNALDEAVQALRGRKSVG